MQGWHPNLPYSNGFLMPSGEVYIPYSASMDIDHQLGQFFRCMITTAAAHTFANPTNRRTWLLRLLVWNNTAGVIATATWGSYFVLDGAWVPPAAGKVKIIDFQHYSGYDKYFEVRRSGI